MLNQAFSDVDANGVGSAQDALHILNLLNRYGPGSIRPDIVDLYYDVNADGLVTPLDVLLLINELNRRSTSATVGNGEGSPEGEQVAPADLSVGLEKEDLLSDSKLSPIGPDTTFGPIGGDDLEWSHMEKTSAGVESPLHAERVDQTLRLLSDEGT